MKRSLKDILTKAVALEASDVHLTIGKPPVLRIHGELVHFDEEKLTPENTLSMVKEVLPGSLEEQLEHNREVDFSYGIPGVSRFRLNAYYQRSHLSLAIRIIQSTIPTLSDLHMPDIFIRDSRKETGACASNRAYWKWKINNACSTN